MKTVAYDVLIILLIAAGLVYLTGCTSRRARMQTAMEPLVGVLTYDEALTSMGPPSATSIGDAVIVAEWSQQKTTEIGTMVAGVLWSQPLVQGERLRLTFDKRTRKLTAWKHDIW